MLYEFTDNQYNTLCGGSGQVMIVQFHEKLIESEGFHPGIWSTDTVGNYYF